MHLGKIKVMYNSVVNKTDISINGRKIKEVYSYIYLRQKVTKVMIKNKSLDRE